MPGTLFVVATPIGNLEDVTARALRVLREVTLIAAEDTRRTAHLLARYSIVTPVTSLHEHNETRKTSALIDRLQRGESIALVSDAGTPLVSDPGQHLVGSAIENGIRIEPIPGPSAVTAALTVSGFPTESFTFLGFPPARGKDRRKWFARLSAVGGTIVFFEAPHRIQRTLGEILAQLGDLPVVACREMTKIHEILVRGQISGVIKQLDHAKGELTIVLKIGYITNSDPVEPLSDRDIAIEFGEMTKTSDSSRRDTIAALARRHRRPPNEIYRAVERGLKLV